MKPNRSLAALGAASVAVAPAALALADTATPAEHVSPRVLHAHLAGTPTVAAQFRRVERALRARRAKLAARRAAHARNATYTGPLAGVLAKIAACESGGNPAAIGGGGAYRGAYQMTFAAWASVGGHGDPATAPMAEQTRRAALLYTQSGAGQWPVCGR
jgi:hypothetical protein